MARCSSWCPVITPVIIITSQLELQGQLLASCISLWYGFTHVIPGMRSLDGAWEVSGRVASFVVVVPAIQ